MKVAVIGAGPSGLTAIKSCIDDDLDVMCFEQEDDIGGLWYFTDDDRHSSVCKSTVINTSKEMMSYSDFPCPKEFPIFMPNWKVIEYLDLYCRQFEARKYISFNTVVQEVKRTQDHSENGKWEVHYCLRGKEITGRKIEVFDAVLVCTGHHWKPNVPKFEGADMFKGRKLHSKSYKDFKEFENQTVLVIGIGNSGGDIAVELSRHTKQAYLSTRRGAWVFSRFADSGYPADQFVNRRIFTYVPEWIQSKMVHKILDSRFDHEKFGLRPKHSPQSQHPTVNDDLPQRIANGTLIIKPNVKVITETGVIFEDGTEIPKIDAIIFATGYQIGFPCLEKSVAPIENNKVPLYKFIFPYDHTKPTLAILGCFQPIGAIMPLSELQARWAVKVFKGERRLPSKEQMLKEIDEKYLMMQQKYYTSKRHTVQVNYIEYADELAELIGCRPNLIKLFFKDPELAFRCFFGPCFPYQYRLIGPGTWDGAKNALVVAEENLIHATRTRVVSPTQDSEQDSESTFLRKIMLATILFTLIAIIIKYLIFRYF